MVLHDSPYRPLLTMFTILLHPLSIFPPDPCMDLVRSEDRIRALINQVIVTTDPTEFAEMIDELKEALRAHIAQTKMLAISSWAISSRDES